MMEAGMEWLLLAFAANTKIYTAASYMDIPFTEHSTDFFFS